MQSIRGFVAHVGTCRTRSLAYEHAYDSERHFASSCYNQGERRTLTEGRAHMAGRPRKKAEKVTGLEDEALGLSMGVFLEMPKKYLERPDYDPICQAWNDAMDATGIASTAMQKLGDMLRKKAKIDEPGPWEKILLEDGKTYKPVGANWNFLSACAGVVRSRAQLQCGQNPTETERPLEAPVGG